MSAKITGIGYYIPERIMTNSELETMVDTTDEWIVTRTGIRERRIAAPDQAASDLGFEAAKAALKNADLDPKELDLIVVATVTPDMALPATGCILQDKLGATKAAAFDVSAACSGFIYALTMVQSMVGIGHVKKALVVGVEVLSKITDWEDRKTCILFGDGAGAVVVERCPQGEGILGTFMQSDGSLGELLYLPGGGSRNPITKENLEQRLQYVKMKGDGLFKYAVRSMVDAAKSTLVEAGLTTKDVDFLIPHQANIRIIEGVRKRLKLDMDQVVVNIDRIGNTSTASIPIALGELNESGNLKKGDLVIMVAFGGGLTWGSVLFRR
ncbi:MAG: ketoacyl-ACP synthase III [Candidatus Krumholzibacteriota bacterium]|nr:ketoacyl-ACP synthase III [Candidatus Krumholzibacteriota bacterium]